jgi:hypothetical protein
MQCMPVVADEPFHEGKLPVARVTVFIHGSVFSGFSMFNLSRVLNDDLTPTCRYVRCVTAVRSNPILLQEQCMLDCGLHEISADLLAQIQKSSLADEYKRKAAYALTAAYDMVAALEPGVPTYRYYYAFGHLGLLSHTYRLKAAHELYDQFMPLLHTLCQRHERVEVYYVVHSHAGNIILNLAACEQEKKKGLFIDVLCMYGTPIQQETIMHAADPIFGKIINCWSMGDIVQGVDSLSTKTRRSYQKLLDNKLHQTNAMPSVIDMRLIVNKNLKHIDHANMWLIGRSRPLDKRVEPLPLMVLTPLILASIKQVGIPSCVNACLTIDEQNLSVMLLPEALLAPSLPASWSSTASMTMDTVCRLTQLVKDNWIPADGQRSPIINGKSFVAVRDGIAKWWLLKRNKEHKPHA